MGQTQDSTGQSERAGEDFESKRTAYDHARDWLFFLIDQPDKTVSVREYRAQLKDAKQAHDRAHKAMMAAWA